MKKTDKTFKRRLHHRFRLKNGAYAVLRYKPAEMGLIVNMSKDGLAVRYSTGKAQLGEVPEIDIFMIDCHFYIANVPVKTIADFELTGKPAFDSEIIRQRCFQFGEMKSRQLFQLNYLLENYTTLKYSQINKKNISPED
jgi:hypothetical protein